MDKYYIRGIQQIGVGVSDVEEAWKWYREHFGADIKIFDDNNPAEFMLPYTGGEPKPKRAIMVVNLQGGGGFEIWEHQSLTPREPVFPIALGDLGIYACKIKVKNLEAVHQLYSSKGLDISDIAKGPDGHTSFWLTDPWNNKFQMVEDTNWFVRPKTPTGLALGAVLGVPDIDKAMNVYGKILGYTDVIYDVKEGTFDDFASLPGGGDTYRRVLLGHPDKREGGFGRLLGPSQLELVEVKNRKPKMIFKDRFWGELGFIHLCFDIQNMAALRKACEAAGQPFTVDSETAQEGSSFDMGESSGLFSYIEDGGGVLIEFVEAHSLPLIKAIGLELNLKKRRPDKPLPRWMLKTLKWQRRKD